MYLFVSGTPAPQGSTRAFIPKGWQRAVVTADNKNTYPWRNEIAATALRWLDDPDNPVPAAGVLYPSAPVMLGMVFVMPRRKAEPKRTTPPHTRKPDLDKLIRATMDAISKLVYTDDAQVVGFDRVKKRTARIGELAGLHLTARPDEDGSYEAHLADMFQLADAALGINP